MDESERRRYRIQAVAEKTGVPAATLRAWERRYGVPRPVRSAAAYRSYSDADLAAILRLKGLCADGHSPSEAARLLKQEIEPAPTRRVGVAPSPDAFQQCADAVVEAARRLSPELMEASLARANVMGSGAQVFEQILRPALRRIGDLWHEGLFL